MRTVVALFDRFDDGQRAIRALTDQGFPNSEINLIVNDEQGEYSRQLGELGESGVDTTDSTDGAAAGAGIGAVLGGIGGLLLGLGALAIPGIGPVIAAGPIVATLAGAGVGAVAGGLIGALVDLGIPEEHAEYYAEGVRRGGTLVTVRTDDERAEDVRSLLNRYNPVDIETRSQDWRDKGWTGFTEGDSAMQDDRDRSTSMPVAGTNMERDYDSNVDKDHAVYNVRDRSASMPVTGTDVERDYDSTVDKDQAVYDVRDRSTSMPVTGADVERDYDSTVDKDQAVYDVRDLDDHTREDVFGTNRAGLNIDMPVTGGGMSGTTGTTNTMGTGMGTDFGDEGWDKYDQTFRSDYQTRYGRSGFGYDYYQPAYRYGYDLSREERFRGYDWDRLEPEARRDWESRGISGAWDEVKDAVRHAWENITN